MKLDLLKEPELVFGKGKHICPRKGISEYDVYDINLEARKSDFLLGIVGTDENIEQLNNWLQECQGFIKSGKTSGQVNLNVPFPGINSEKGYCANFKTSTEITRVISRFELGEILGEYDREKKVMKAVNTFYNHCKFLAQDKKVDIIICLIPEIFEEVIVLEKSAKAVEESAEDDETQPLETNFRRALKAKCMDFDAPLQLMREIVLTEKRKSQDKATRAWNFCTGIYYKAMQTIPWKLDRDINQPSACYVGVSFYRSRDKTTMQTSLAQVFNENGNGIILRGSPVKKDKVDLIPHLKYKQAFDLLDKTLEHYRFAVGNVPGRLVLHKSSKFYEDELEGFEAAAKKYNVVAYDFITIQETDIRFFRQGLYPPNRGTMITLDEKNIILYTRGSVQHYQTYPGIYIPAPLLVHLEKSASSPKTVCNEILGLSKMNWNNTQFDGKYPITIGCARKVGEIMKYLDKDSTPRTKYAFYM